MIHNVTSNLASLPLASWWFAAGVSGYAWTLVWQDWAARAIASSPAPAAWIVEMGKAESIYDLSSALAPQVALENVDPLTIGDALLGYVWMRYEREELQLFDCLCYAISKAEDHPSSIGCEAIYRLLNKLRWDNHERIVAEGNNLFQDCKVRAAEQWANLISAQQAALKSGTAGHFFNYWPAIFLSRRNPFLICRGMATTTTAPAKRRGTFSKSRSTARSMPLPRARTASCS